METIDAETAWGTLSALGVERVPGTPNDKVEILIALDGHPYVLPIVAHKGLQIYYMKQAFEKIVDDLLS